MSARESGGTRATDALGRDPHLTRLASATSTAESRGLRALDATTLTELPELYRYAATRLAEAETAGSEPARVAALRGLLGRAHALLHRDLERHTRGFVARAIDFFANEVPAAVRAEWRPILVSFVVIYGLAIVSFLAVRADVDRAWSLLDPTMVATEIQQLEESANGAPFRGNFTFGLEESPLAAGAIIGHNLWVAVLYFGAALVPPVYVYFLAVNGLMLGTYTAVAAHYGQALSISSILWSHGVLEIQALVLAGAAGLVLVRGVFLPGAWSRGHAFQLSAARSLRLFAPVVPLLVCAGSIEGWVSPHAGLALRVATAITSAAFLVAWFALGGRASLGGSRAAPRVEPSGDRGSRGLGR